MTTAVRVHSTDLRHAARPRAVAAGGRHPPVLVPLVGLLAATMIFRATALDLTLARPFLGDPAAPWPWVEAQPWITLYHWGVAPAWLLGAAGLLVALGALLWTQLRPYARQGLFLALLLAVGPGLLINGVMKPSWGRPRPNQTAALGGALAFEPVGDFGADFTGKSFPSGHASMGFYLLAPMFLLWRRKPTWAMVFLGLGIAGGLAMGVARIVQGRHFASDVLWSAAIVYFTGVALYWLLRLDRDEPAHVAAEVAAADLAAPVVPPAWSRAA